MIGVDLAKSNESLSRVFEIEVKAHTIQEITKLVHRVVTNVGAIKWKLTGLWLASTNVSLNDPDFSLPAKSSSYAIPGRKEVQAGLRGMKLGDSPIVTIPQPYTRGLEVEGRSKKDKPFSVLAAVRKAAMP